nr:nitrilase-related carbon-nitrogen hydrolase [Kibdelosporangium sp. MJ126-NF4]CEL23250.1 Apolipoprotein N-acyltransferase / Copper homeostasis protein CutE [Kibdelosporangium sp. MJ126-NF4]CTQ94412.1 Apolipoprotein N-acyltransferase (EC 2.3.1.-) / Copper homeostasis protein CutE [Kibdelosporangium sp. MJ126-NF4]
MGFAKWIPLAATAASTALFFFGMGLSPVPALAWLIPLPILLVAKRISGWAAAGAGFFAGFVGSTNLWSWSAGSHDLPLLPWGLAVSVGFGGTFALAVTVFRLLPPPLAVVAAPAAWVTPLYLVSVLNPMGIVGTLATTQADVPVVLQFASITGAWGVDYLVFFIPTAVALLRPRIAVAAAGVAALVVFAGVYRMSSSPGPTVRVALVASDQKGWAADLNTPEGGQLLAAYLRQIEALPSGVQLVVLPEAAFGSTEESPASLAEPMRRIANDRGFTVVVGYAHWAPPKKYNYAISFPSGARYLKHHDAVSPAGKDLVFADLGPVGIEICLDVNFRAPSASYAAAGANLLAIPASDEDANGWQHSRTALLRGVENGVGIAWSGRQTNLMLSDGYGRVLASQPTGPRPDGFTTAIADVPLGTDSTPYTQLGDWFPWLCVALTAVGVGTVFVRKKSRPTEHVG